MAQIHACRHTGRVQFGGSAAARAHAAGDWELVLSSDRQESARMGNYLPTQPRCSDRAEERFPRQLARIFIDTVSITVYRSMHVLHH